MAESGENSLGFTLDTEHNRIDCNYVRGTRGKQILKELRGGWGHPLWFLRQMLTAKVRANLASGSAAKTQESSKERSIARLHTQKRQYSKRSHILVN